MTGDQGDRPVTQTGDEGDRPTLGLRRRVEPERGSGPWQEVSVRRSITPAKSAVLVCDVWDAHWCRTAAERSADLACRIDELTRAARSAGARIVHSPSGTLEYYEGTPQRQRMKSLPMVEPPEPLELPDAELPIDDSDGGCDTGDCQPQPGRRPWRRQHAAIEIAEEDVISEDGGEVYSMLRGAGVDTLFFTGVHVNMCVLDRPFGIKQMTRWGVDCVLVRDLTDSMYNPKRAPYVSHDEGTRLVVEHIERHWCPTTTSGELAALLKGCSCKGAL